jgi:hypothetical protein
MAPTLVFTLFIGMNGTPCFKVGGYRFDGRGRFARQPRRNCRASRQSRPQGHPIRLFLHDFPRASAWRPRRQELQGEEVVAGRWQVLPGSDCRAGVRH